MNLLRYNPAMEKRTFDSLEIRRAAASEARLLAIMEAACLAEETPQKFAYAPQADFIQRRTRSYKDDLERKMPIFVAVAPKLFTTRHPVLDNDRRQLAGFVALSPPVDQHGRMQIDWLYALESPFAAEPALLKHAITRADFYQAETASVFTETERASAFFENYGMFAKDDKNSPTGPMHLFRNNFQAAIQKIDLLVHQNPVV